MPTEKALSLGEQMYRRGMLPSGKPMQAKSKGGVQAPGTTFACSSCHLRSGIGGSDEGLATPPINGPWLAQPLYRKLSKINASQRASLGMKTLPLRPAYNDDSLARAIRNSVDPAGRKFNPGMPAYDLTDQNMAILINYLKNLSTQTSPGATDQALHFATVITEEVSPEDREAMLLPLDNYILMHNRMAGGFGSKMYVFGDGPEMQLSFRELTLDRWELKGPPDTWRRQLEAYNREDPPFALLGGITYGNWQPVHNFCEAAQIPCLFPLTDYPVIAENDWYTLYLSKGFQQEGITAAHYLKDTLAATPGAKTIQVVQDSPQGRALAAGFLATWKQLEGRRLKTLTLTDKQIQDPKYLSVRLRREKADAIVLWTSSDAFPTLASLAAPGHPRLVLMSSSYLKQDLAKMPEKARSFTCFTYPYRHPQDEPKFSNHVNSLLIGYKTYHPETRISTRMYSLTEVLTTALVDMEQNLYRDTFLDVIAMQRDQILPDYERLSFGSGQRYASRGCYIMQLSEGLNPAMLKKSIWLVY